MQAKVATLAGSTMLVAWVAGATGCSVSDSPAEPETPATELASRVCHWAFLCECGVSFADEAVCRGVVTSVFELEHDSATQAGLLQDQGCLDALLDDLDFEGCLPEGVRPQGSCDAPCQLFHGTQPARAPCRWHGNFHDCRQGLSCERQEDGSDVCVDPCPRPLPEGARCTVHSPECDAAHELVCVLSDLAAAEGTCQRLAGPGEACLDDTWCVHDAYCDSFETEDPVCRKLPGLGEPCAPPQRCDYTDELLLCDTTDPRRPVCQPAPRVGDPCPAGLCNADAYCDNAPDPVCRPTKAAGSPCTSSLECASLLCIEDQCVDNIAPPLVCRLAERLSILPPAED